MNQRTFIHLAFPCLLSATSGLFGRVSTCEYEQSVAYSKLGESLAKEYRAKFVSYDQLINTTEVVTGNATFQPLCMWTLAFSYQYYLKEQNVSYWGILLASLERTAQLGKTICQCKVANTLSYISEELLELGDTPYEEEIGSVLHGFGYTQHPDWYLNCPVLDTYLRRLEYKRRHQGTGRLDEEKIQQIKAAFQLSGKLLMRPLLVYKTESENSLLDAIARKNEFYCYIYNSSARIFAQKNETLGNQQMLFLVETVGNETGHSRLDASCLDKFLEEYGRQSDLLGVPTSSYNMLEGLYRNNEILSTVTDYDKCKCRIPSLSKKLVKELIWLGPTPNEMVWNEIMKKYWYIPWATDYQHCPVLEWYLEAVAQKFGVPTAEQRFLEVGFDMVKVLNSFSKKAYWR